MEDILDIVQIRRLFAIEPGSSEPPHFSGVFPLSRNFSSFFATIFSWPIAFCQQVRYNVLTAGTIPETPPDPAVTFPILYMTRGVIKLHTGTMWALVKDQPAKGLSMKRVEIPTVGENDVMIKIHKTAI